MSKEVTDAAGSDALPRRQFGWSNMFVAADEDPRSQAPVHGELATLRSYLTAYRQTLELKCTGLTAEQLARRSVPPSDLSLLGLVRHLTDVEWFWFRRVMNGDTHGKHYPEQTAISGAVADPRVVDEAWAAWRTEVARSDRYIDAARDLGVSGVTSEGNPVALREVLVHLIEEYARHCGHADLIRERIDGRVGQ